MKGPARLRVPIDRTEANRPPRIGKIRLGLLATTTKNGKQVSYPKAVDYFRVEEDESGITSAEAAAAFREVYGDKPKRIRVALVGHKTESVLESAWRLYGASKLKKICDGTTCSVRGEKGGWIEGPCDCATNNLPLEHRDHCQLTTTLWVALPDVRGLGLWEIDSGSEIGERELRDHFLFIEGVRGGTLMGYEFDLTLRPVQVAPDGKAKTVHTLYPIPAVDVTPRDAAAQATALDAASVKELPPPAPVVDQERDTLISPTPEAQAAAETAEESQIDQVSAAFKALSDEAKAALCDALTAADCDLRAGAILERYGDAALDLGSLLATLSPPPTPPRVGEADQGGEQQTLGGDAA